MNEIDKGDYVRLLRQQTAMAKFGELALMSDNLDEILTEACSLVGAALGTELAKVMELQKDGETLLVRAGVGWKPGVVGKVSIKIGDDTSEGLALKTGDAMISPDIASETRFKYPPFLTENGVKAVANVVIIGGLHRPPFGILQIDSRQPRQFTAEDTTFLRGYANLLAAAVDRLRVLKEMRDGEERMRHAQKMEAIGRLAAGVAHDFNNILQGIIGGLEVILDDVGPGTPAHEFAGIAIKSAMRGSSLTHHLLSYARKQMLRPQVVEVAPFLAEMQTLLGRTLGEQIDIRVRLDQMPYLFVDPGQLQTAILNLAINASHAMPQGGRLSIEAREKSEGGQSLTILAVTDTGAGMNEATLAQAIEPFFTTKGLDGAGLGLSMVQGFVEQSGGTLHIASAPGQGTTVELHLPSAVSEDRRERAAVLQARLDTPRVLLVDDATDVLVTIRAFLEKAGFVVTQVENGNKALALLAGGGRYDAIVSDYAMPGLNGADLIAEARIVRPGLPALLITGYASAINDQVLPAGTPVLHKPFQRLELIEALQRVMHANQDENITMPSSTTVKTKPQQNQ